MSEKIRIHPILDDIQNEYSLYVQILKPFEEKINRNSETKYILSFCNIAMCYGKEAAFLYNNSWCTSIEPIARDFLECYAIIKNLIRRYPNNIDYNEYIQYLYYLEMNQTIITIKAFDCDFTYSVTEREETINTKLENLNFIIENFFSEYKVLIDNENLKKSILNIFKEIKKKYEYFDVPKAKNIERALLDNQAWIKHAGEPYKGAGVLYGELCNSSHSNIYSVMKRTINNNYFMMNTEPENILPALSVIVYCMKDINCSLRLFFENL